MSITHNKCQWIGTGQDSEKVFPVHMCGQATVLGRSYCATHVWGVYQQGTSKGNARKLKELSREIDHILKKEIDYDPENDYIND
jgi:hypothetical protein